MTTEKTHICPHRPIGFATDGEGDEVPSRKDSFALGVTEEMKSFSGEVNYETLLRGVGGKIKIAKVSGSRF